MAINLDKSGKNLEFLGPILASQSPLEELLGSWCYALRAEHKSPRTIETYALAVNQLLAHNGGEIPTRLEIRTFLNWFLDNRAPATAAIRHRGLKRFFDWCVMEKEIPESPMTGMREPKVPEVEIPVLEDGELSLVFATCQGGSFFQIRDQAVLRTFLSSGCRLGEFVGMTLADLKLEAGMVHVKGKGRRSRHVGLSAKTIVAIDRYLRARRNTKLRSIRSFAEAPQLWLGKSGPLTKEGVAKIVLRRGEQAGVKIHAHLFRHTFS